MYNSIYPNYANAYYGINNRQITRRKDEDKSSQSSNATENNPQEERKSSSNNNQNTHFPNGEKVAIDYTKKRIGIDQVLSDFRNTANAIGAPDNIKSEVASYLTLIENQAQKENPNPQIVQSNLKNASQILDEYITKTLKKPSKVVENWVDALFLQQIDYKSEVLAGAAAQVEAQPIEEPAEEIVEEPEAIQAEAVEEVIVEEQEPPKPQVKSGVYVPEDPQLKRMFIQAKKYAAIDNKEQALYSFQNTMEYAEDIGDIQTCAMINYEEGRLYDDFNQVEDALYCYHQATQQSSDNNLKARAHLSMGKIYDDFVNFAPAVDHFCSAVSFAGEADNQILQTQALTDLAQVHTDRYDKENAIKFMDMSTIVANETNNGKVKGITYSRNAKMSEKLGEKIRALNMYSNSAQSFHTIEDNENLAKNYRSAAEIMLQYGNTAKAKRLLSKAYIAAQQTGNSELKELISQDLATV
ncbi:MAG: hypothetical protein IJY61_02040 [Candidatus Gastranaerophilales bacterium]|nr:hypothetical protein [Candidatus Gastranaerophilales bacterium]